MTENQRIMVYGGVGLAAVAAFFYWRSQNQPGAVANPNGGYDLTLPSSGTPSYPVYTPSTPFTGSAVTSPTSSQPSEPSSTVIFNFNPNPTPAVVAAGGAPHTPTGGSFTSADGGVSGAGCGCNGTNTSCAGSSNPPSFGSAGDAASFFGPLLQFIGQQVPQGYMPSVYDVAQTGIANPYRAWFHQQKQTEQDLKTAAQTAWSHELLG